MAKSGSKDSQAVNDAYTGMLAVSLIALAVGCVILFLDYNQYPQEKPKSFDPFKPAPAAVAPEPPPPMPMPPMPMPPEPPAPVNP